MAYAVEVENTVKTYRTENKAIEVAKTVSEFINDDVYVYPILGIEASPEYYCNYADNHICKVVCNGEIVRETYAYSYKYTEGTNVSYQMAHGY